MKHIQKNRMKRTKKRRKRTYSKLIYILWMRCDSKIKYTEIQIELSSVWRTLLASLCCKVNLSNSSFILALPPMLPLLFFYVLFVSFSFISLCQFYFMHKNNNPHWNKYKSNFIFSPYLLYALGVGENAIAFFPFLRRLFRRSIWRIRWKP